MAQTFSLLWDSIPRCHKRKVPASVETRMGGKKENRGIFYPFASNCVALKATGVHTNPQKDAATNPPIQGRKSTVICVQAKQMLTELNNKCVKATL